MKLLRRSNATTRNTQPAKKTSKVILSSGQRIVLFGVATLFLLAALFSAGKTFSVQTVQERNVHYSYTLSANAVYRVELLPNDLYPEPWLAEGRLYSRQLIRQVVVDLQADFVGTSQANLNGSYDVTAVVEGYQGPTESRTSIYERKYPLIQSAPVKVKGQSSSISDSVAIDLEAYRNFANSADIALGAKPSRQLKLIYSGTFTAETEYGSVSEPFSYTINIPLSSGTELFTITKSSPISKSNVIAETYDVIQMNNPTVAILSIIWILIAIIAWAVLFFLTRLPKGDEVYLLAFKTIIRKYGSRMVQLDKLPPITSDRLIPLADISSLIKAADEYQRPVCYAVDSTTGLPVEGVLYVPTETVHYILYLSTPEKPDLS